MKARATFQRFGWGGQGRPRRHPLIAGVLILALVAQFGCASSGTDKRSALILLQPPPGETALKVAVTSGRFTPTFGIIKSDTHSVKEQLLFVALSPLIVVLMVPLFLLVLYEESAVERAERAEVVAKIEKREATIHEMVAAQRIQDDLLARVIVIGGKITPHAFMELTDRGPSTPGDHPDYHPLLQEVIYAVLEVVVESVALDGISDFGWDFRLIMSVNTRLVRTVDNAEIYVRTRTYYGKSWRTMEEWVGDPEGLRDELNQAYADIAEKTVEEIFLRPESN
ncbi:hypothetical protein MELA_02316 [Candidatus Methylomirabilis lanthanidiphila]|uniref:Uncharacterized protein n=1 Tax=Candidatus Methylomirabilis lanthanidiphila TaxID=2211376 RepID=A0A564ZKS3_9BACT|nr:hypothetical protein [Candidatus Methylomirabilis lanthanidiphila]VUZ85929.1 hypothetical protein MELA_02316 [Candidatus Methylomirabilis lanthanidiphila]